MKRKCLIVTHHAVDLTSYQTDIYDFIGVESGCLLLIKKKLHIKCAIGDFDSVTPSERDLILNYAASYQLFDTDKDFFDGELAIKWALEKGYHDILFLSYSRHLEMDLVILYLVARYNIQFKNQNTFVKSLTTGVNYVKPNSSFRYISFVALSNATIKINGFRWNKNHLVLTPLSPEASHNEFVLDQSGQITVDHGRVLAIYS